MRFALLALLCACGGTEPTFRCDRVLANVGGVAVGCNCPTSCDDACPSFVCERFSGGP